MKQWLLKYLRCPACASAFSVSAVKQRDAVLSSVESGFLQGSARNNADYTSDIDEGVLQCEQCALIFPIIQGVPRIYKDAAHDYPVNHGLENVGSVEGAKHEKHVQTSFTREWDEFNYDDQTIWLWTLDHRVETFCEELGISSPAELKGKLMVDAGCGSGILSMTLAERYGVEIIAMDMSHVITRAARRNKSNLCHFVQCSVLNPPLAKGIADVTYSHGVLHHTYNTKKAFDAIAPLTKKGGVLYVWLYGRKKGWNRFRFLFIRSARFVIARLPRIPQTIMVYVMTVVHLTVRFIKRMLGMEKVQYKTMAQFLVSMRDKYTPLYAREHGEAEVKQWFEEAGFINVERRLDWPKTPWWRGSTDLSIRGRKG